MNYGNSSKNNLINDDSGTKYFDMSYSINADNNNASFSILSKNIKPYSTVLDVGCSDGKWGRFLKDRNCKCYGIDISLEAVKFSQKQNIYEKISQCNIEAADFLEQIRLWGQTFDYIGCFDVLEHTVNPTAALEKLCSLLKKDGQLLISIPNIGNADIFLNLMNGRFNYSDTGILDNTHNKFFTKHSFAEWIEGLNSNQMHFKLECEYVGGTFGNTDYLENIQINYPHLYSAIQLNPQFNVVQLLFILTKKDCDYRANQLEGLLREPLYDNLLQALETNILEDSHLKKLLSSDNISANERRDYLERIQTMECQLNKNHHDLKTLSELNAEQKEKFKLAEDEIKSLSAKLEDANSNWRACAQKLDDTNKNWSDCAQKLDNANKGWNNCAQKLEKANAGWHDCAQELEKANAGWHDCAQKLDNANKGWSDCAQKLEKANGGWSDCAQELEKANIGWHDCAQKLEAAHKGWSNCAEELEKANVGWTNCADRLAAADIENARLENQLIDEEAILREQIHANNQLKSEIQEKIDIITSLQERNTILKELLEEEKALYKEACGKYRMIESNYKTNGKKGMNK